MIYTNAFVPATPAPSPPPRRCLSRAAAGSSARASDTHESPCKNSQITKQAIPFGIPAHPSSGRREVLDARRPLLGNSPFRSRFRANDGRQDACSGPWRRRGDRKSADDASGEQRAAARATELRYGGFPGRALRAAPPPGEARERRAHGPPRVACWLLP